MGIEDFMNETYTLYSGTLFSFEDVKAEMDYLRGKRTSGGKVSIKKFIDGLMLEAER
jgi:two-component system response regulator YcbB